MERTMQAQAIQMAAAPQPATNALCRQHSARLPSTPQQLVPLRASSKGNARSPVLSSRSGDACPTGRARAGAEASGEASQGAGGQSVGRRPILTALPFSTAVAAAAALLPLVRPVSAQEEAALMLEEGAPGEPLDINAPETLGAAPGPEPSAAAEPAPSSPASSGSEPSITSRVYLDIAIEGAPAGRIVIGLYGKDVPLGAARFEALVRGQRGVSLRRKEFMKLTPAYTQNAGLRAFSLTGSSGDEAQFPGGVTADALLPELERAKSDLRPALHNTKGAVSILALDPELPPPKQRLMAKGGKLVTVEEEVRAPPNGTEFAVLFADAPELDPSHVVVGRVLEGQGGALEAIQAVPYVQDNSGSPYFKAAKLIGDTRAVVAERGFYRPYKKIVIKQCGTLE